MGEEKNEIWGMAFGLRIGYTFSPIKGDWKLEDNDVSGGPDIGVTGPYLKLMIGGGGKSKK